MTFHRRSTPRPDHHEAPTGSTRFPLAQSIAVGVGATIVMDAAAAVIRRTTGVAPLDYALVGRWVGHLARAQVRHDSIADAEPVPHERSLGWVTHYAIGTGFAVALVAVKPSWLDRPTLGPALALGVGTVAAPWLILQPAFGLGIAGANTPDPHRTRVRSLRTHAIYGIGIWLAGKTVRTARGVCSSPVAASAT